MSLNFTVNISMFLTLINKVNIRQGMNMRCFEAPACGCILVSEYVKDLEFAFSIENEIITFQTLPNCKANSKKIY